MNHDKHQRALERLADADDESEAAIIALDLARVRAGLEPEYVAPCQRGCDSLIYIDDQGTGGRCPSCCAWFCEDHGHVPQGDYEGECHVCYAKFEEECRQAQEEALREWWETERAFLRDALG